MKSLSFKTKSANDFYLNNLYQILLKHIKPKEKQNTFHFLLSYLLSI